MIPPLERCDCDSGCTFCLVEILAKCCLRCSVAQEAASVTCGIMSFVDEGGDCLLLRHRIVTYIEGRCCPSLIGGRWTLPLDNQGVAQVPCQVTVLERQGNISRLVRLPGTEDTPRTPRDTLRLSVRPDRRQLLCQHCRHECRVATSQPASGQGTDTAAEPTGIRG